MLTARELIPFVDDVVASAAALVLAEHDGLGFAERERSGAPASAAPGHVCAVVDEPSPLVAFPAPCLVNGCIGYGTGRCACVVSWAVPVKMFG